MHDDTNRTDKIVPTPVQLEAFPHGWAWIMLPMILFCTLLMWVSISLVQLVFWIPSLLFKYMFPSHADAGKRDAG